MHKSLIFLILIAITQPVLGQLRVDLNHDVKREYGRQLEVNETGFHTAIRPYLDLEVAAHTNRDSLFHFKRFDNYIDQLANGHLLAFRSDKMSLSVDPLFDLLFAYDVQQKETVSEFGMGARVAATFWNRLGIGFSYRAYRGDPYSYVRERIANRQVVPGYRKTDDVTDQFLKSHEFEGYISIVANEHFRVDGGFGKHFWGDGYRSLFLSDNAPAYPYLQFTLDFWRIKYAYLFTVLKYGEYDLPTNSFDLSDPQTKHGVFHYLSIDVAKWLQFGFFEGVIWKRADSTGVRGVEWNYLNPVVFIRPVEFALGSPDNVILGFNFKFKIGDKNQLYTQLVLDDLDIGKAREGSGFYRSKIAWQVGWRSYDLFKLEHLDLQTEFNLVRPYTYAHKTTEQNYAHFSQALAHPLGANFWEWLIFLDYRKGRWEAGLDFQWAVIGDDDLTNPDNNHNGSNIYVSDFEIVDNISANLDFAYGNEFLQGVRHDIARIRVSGGYLLNPQLNMKLELFVEHRADNLPEMGLEKRNTSFGIRWSTSLFNQYYDF